ncbi:MAG TPA: hypothetical protein VMZ90_03990 [Vicinamibacterales bacterium]|nr:hypothetical protein [Vicinamibacterales bacterium]
MRQTPTAVVELNGDRIVTVRVRAGAAQSVSDAEKNLSAALELRNGERRPILVDIRDAVPLEADVRRYYSGQVLVGFTCLALLIKANPLGRMIGNIYLRIANTGIPTRLFTDESAALQWLRN